jgi:hypothetical protein
LITCFLARCSAGDGGEHVAALGAPLGVTYLQGTFTSIEVSQSSVTASFPQAQTQGSLNVVVVGWNDVTNHVAAVSDTSGNTYRLAPGTSAQNAGAPASIAMYYAPNVASGANTVAVTFSAPVAFPEIMIAEYSGLDTAAPFDVGSASGGTGLTSDSGAATTTAAGDLLVGANYLEHSSTAPGPGFTERFLTGDMDILEDRTAPTPGSYDATSPLNLSGWWVATMGAFRPAQPADAGSQDAAADSGVDAGHDSGVDAGSDSGVDAGHDSGGDADASSPFTLLVSRATDRSAATPLQGASLSALECVFTSDGSGSVSPAGIQQVSYWLDDPAMTGAATHVERITPYDFVGTNADGTAEPWDTTKVAAGTHTLTQAVVTSSGAVQTSSATFSLGSTTSSAPVITGQPSNQAGRVGQTVTFSVVATGSAPLGYQWSRNGSAIGGATASSYKTSALSSSDNGATFSVVVGNAAGSAQSSSATLTVESAVTFPLGASANGRYFVDQNGVPFRIHGDASWDAHLNLGLADLRVYLDDRKAKGFDALFTYVTNPVAYAAGASTPWALQLGGRGVAAALPFTTNASGGAWDGDPTFAHHDASFASPNDAYFAWVAQFVDEAAARGMVVMMAPMYLGFGLGQADGWWQTVINSANTQSVCFAFGQYLANGHGPFTGFKNRPNILWVNGGDTLPPNGSEGALRALQVLKGMQAAGDTHLQTAHWQADDLTLDQTDFAPFMTAYAAYTHGAYPSLGPTYAESRALYSQPTTRPAFLLETNYWGDHGATRDNVRYFEWGSALSTIGGTTFGFTPLWIFTTSPDGTNGTIGISVTGTTAWVPGTAYPLDTYVSKGGNWYRAIAPGTSGSTGPSGTGASIVDGSVTWTYAGTGGYQALLNEPGEIDMQTMGALLDGLAWYNLVPSGLGGMQTLISAGTGTFASWSDQSHEVGGMDWIVSAATPDGTLLVAYVPDAHAGSFTVAMSALSASSRARWYDPAGGTFTADPSGTGFTLPNAGGHAFTIPGINGAGAHDWVLVLDTHP